MVCADSGSEQLNDSAAPACDPTNILCNGWKKTLEKIR